MFKRILSLLLLLSLSLHALELTDNSGELKKSVKELAALFDISPNLPVDQLLPLLQKHWLQVNKERWEMEKRFEDKKAQALPLLEEIGCVKTVRASKKEYTHALVLGAIGKTMQRRLDFLYEEWQRGVRFKEIFLLSGQRDLDPKMETIPEGVKTETELFVYLYNHHPLKNCGLPMRVVDSPKEALPDGTVRRPNTGNTVRDWLALSPQPGSCLVISTQPYVGYQEAVVRFLVPNSYQIECVGPQTENVYLDTSAFGNRDYPLAIYLDSITKWLLYERLKQIQ